jgi:hypothetical protein
MGGNERRGFYNGNSRALFSSVIGVLDVYDNFHRDAFYRDAGNLNAGTVPAARLGGSPTFNNMSLSGNAYFSGAAFLSGNTYFSGAVYPRTNPISGSHFVNMGEPYTPQRGWYSFSTDNNHFGRFASGPYSGTIKVYTETSSISSVNTIYYKKY